MTTITVYPITGRQVGPFGIRHRFCGECDLTITAVRRLVADLRDDDLQIEIKPWLRHALEALRRCGWHPPVVVIDGRVFSQGVVPDIDELKTALETAAGSPTKGESAAGRAS
jgi:hypothetical protein